MERQHDSEYGSEQADVGSVGRNGADDDQSFREGYFEFLLRAVSTEIDATVEDPPFHGNRYGPHAQD